MQPNLSLIYDSTRHAPENCVVVPALILTYYSKKLLVKKKV